jgi:hypothetical protein
MKTCPNCAYEMNDFDVRCRRCGRAMEQPARADGTDEPDPSYTCHNCGARFADPRPYCTQCGATSPSIKARESQVWPPPPTGYAPPDPIVIGRLITGKPGGDIALGIGICLAAMVATLVGLLAMVITYAAVRNTYSYFGRGIGIGLIIMVLGFLGLVASCMMGYTTLL